MKDERWIILLSVLAFVIFIAVIFRPTTTTLNFSNPPCYYYVNQTNIKIFGFDEIQNHSISLLRSKSNETKFIVMDKSTNPRTIIPLCIR